MELVIDVGERRVTVSVMIKVGDLPVRDLLDERSLAIKTENQRIRSWLSRMDPKTAEALHFVVVEALDKLRDDVGAWLPASVDIRSGAFIDVSLRLLLTDLDVAYLERERMQQMTVQSAAEELSSLLVELEGSEDVEKNPEG